MNRNDMFYTCSLIEYIGRKTKQSRSEVVNRLGKETLNRIYTHADVFHSDIIDRVADEFIEECDITTGAYDNVAKCKYNVPDYWDIGEVYTRLIQDACVDGVDEIQLLIDIYNSWISEVISNFNSDFYYQPRDYIYECYKENKICA